MANIIWLVILLVLGVIISLGGVNKLYNYLKLCKTINRIPGLPTHWLWGNLHQIKITEEFGFQMYEWRLKHKTNVTCYWLGPFNATVHLTHSDHLKQLLNEPKAENVYSMLEPWLGSGLLITNGNRWHRNRRLLTPAFHFDILKPYVHIYNECTEELLTNWQLCADKQTPVNLCESIKSLSLDILLQCACSYQSGCQKQGCKDPYVKAVEELVFLSTDRFLSPILQASEFLYMYCTSQGWRYRRALNTVHNQSFKVIKERRDSLKSMDDNYQERTTTEILKMAKSSKKALDFLDILLAAQDEDGYRLSDTEVRYEVDTFMFEGHDTTANGITFTLYLLALYPEHQVKCRDEIKDVLRGRERLDYEDLPKLQYTLWCIKESLRRFPPVFNIYRRLTQDIELDGYLIPKGIWVDIDLFGIHVNPDVWENPLEFNPLRFHPDNIKLRKPFSYVPFSAGPRNCIGQNFALDEARIVISSILNRFHVQLVSDEKMEFVPKVVLRPSKEIQLNLTHL